MVLVSCYLIVVDVITCLVVVVVVADVAVVVRQLVDMHVHAANGRLFFWLRNSVLMHPRAARSKGAPLRGLAGTSKSISCRLVIAMA